MQKILGARKLFNFYPIPEKLNNFIPSHKNYLILSHPIKIK
jgi:hypothetical protein